jgi:1-acyl-sn-glycerol-3-phosphate acyltransferase
VPSFEQSRRVRALVGLARLSIRCYHRVTVLTPANLPRTGAVVVAPNHTSGLDPLLVQSVLSRPIAWMMTAEYFDLPSLHWFFSRVGCVRVDRTKRDTSAVRESRRRLADGRALGIFPEGRIEKHDAKLMPLQPGAAALAAKAGVPILPVWIDGTMRPAPGTDAKPLAAYLKSSTAALAFGKLLTPDEYHGDAATATELMLGELHRLRRLTRGG